MLSGCSADSSLLDEAIIAAGSAVAETVFTGIFVPGFNRCRWLANPHTRVLSFFITPEQRIERERVDFRALRYTDILSLLRRTRPTAAAFMVSEPDENGMCSFGTTVDFIADLWRSIPIRIAHINPLMPRTRGDVGIPFSELTACCASSMPLMTQDGGDPDATAEAITTHIVPLICDRATIQTGLGKIPEAVLRGLTSHRGLRIHSGLIGDAVVDLLAAGALAHDKPITAGVAIGTQRLYNAVSQEAFQFRPVSETHRFNALLKHEAPISINSATEVDLFGQGHAELTPRGLLSGPGGAADFAQSVRIGEGLRIIALPSTAAAGKISRIVSAGTGTGPVSLTRSDIDIVATEYGTADLRTLGYEERASALISVAHPNYRRDLQHSWIETRRTF